MGNLNILDKIFLFEMKIKWEIIFENNFEKNHYRQIDVWAIVHYILICIIGLKIKFLNLKSREKSWNQAIVSKFYINKF